MKDRLSRQSFLGENAESVFSNEKIGIIGLCGGGSHVAQQLAHIGFRNFVISDFDHIEEPNLTRMVGSCPADAMHATPKADVITRLIKTINPEANVISIEDQWQTAERIFRECVVIVGCVDKFSPRDELERFCRRYLIPYIDIGMDVHSLSGGHSISGQVITSLPGEVCMRCLGYLTDARIAEEQRHYGAAGGRPQVIWPNGVLASIAVGQLIALLLPWHCEMKPSVMIEYDGNRQITRESSKIHILENNSCPHFPSNASLGDPFFQGIF